MKKFTQQLHKKTDGIYLRSSEKRLLRERVVAYMEYHPLPTNLNTKKADQKQSVSKNSKSITSEAFVVFKLNARWFQSFAILGVLFIVVGLPTLAERSLPGDILYPMKVQVNEEVRSSLAFSPYAKVEWEATRLERRLAEARLLAQAGKLTEEVEQDVAEAVKKHSDSAQQTILALKATDTEEAALAEISLVSVLEAQNDLFNIQNETETSVDDSGEGMVKENNGTLAMAVRTAFVAAENVHKDTPVTPARLFAVIEKETTYAEELFASISKDTSAEEKQNIDRRLDDIRRKVEEAQKLNISLAEMSPEISVINEASTSDGDLVSQDNDIETEVEVGSDNGLYLKTNQEILSLLRIALTDTRKLINFMTDIEIRNSFSVDELVPITLTTEERQIAVKENLNKVSSLMKVVNSKKLEAELVDKVTTGKATVSELVEKANLALEKEALTEAEQATNDALSLAEDLMVLTDKSPVDLTNISIVNSSSSTATATDEIVSTTTDGV
ncbi:hypothetical protein KC845_00225 [Candidatus Kaiserbacteria bacterium]|nr:hypothetical protein [Candidatus Kaiserbacteria bacterium]